LRYLLKVTRLADGDDRPAPLPVEALIHRAFVVDDLASHDLAARAVWAGDIAPRSVA
jgi:hypothetical protein